MTVKAYLWNVATGSVKAKLARRTGEVRSVLFSPDGMTLAGITWNPKDYGDYDYKVFFWDVATGKRKRDT